MAVVAPGSMPAACYEGKQIALQRISYQKKIWLSIRSTTDGSPWQDEKIKTHLREIDRIVVEENQIYLDDNLEESSVSVSQLRV